MRIVIVGNGIAGMEAALAVRRREANWAITIVSEESDHLFSRTALMWVCSGQMRHRDIEPLERDAYERLRLRRVRARATGVDVAGHRLLLAGGIDPLPYDRLLIACGSRPRPGPWPGSDLRGVGHFVTLQDLEWIEREMHGGPGADRPPRPEAHLAHSSEDSPYRPREAAAQKRGRLARRGAVIGGGLIGIEAVEVMLAAGIKPTFLIREGWYWPMAIDARESGWIADRLREHGVEVRLEEEAQGLKGDGDGNVCAIRTDKGTIATDFAVVAIGVIPNTDWLQESAVERDERGGILVDQARGLATRAQDVFAAGDCASVKWFNGAQRPEQLWYTARDQGRIAGGALLGDSVGYQRGIWYNSAKLADIEYTTAGLVNMKLDGEESWFYEERGEVRSITRIVHQGGRVVGFNLLGRRWDHSVLQSWIAQGQSLDYVLKHLREAAFDTEFVPPLRLPREARRRGPKTPDRVQRQDSSPAEARGPR